VVNDGDLPKPDPVQSFFDTLRGAILTSIPVLSALVFVVVAVKVFRASHMETTTTVAIVSNADVFQLLKGIILTLLPGFLAALVAAAVWWWGEVLPERLDAPDAAGRARRGLYSPQAVWAWAMIVTAFFTVWWPVFLLLLVPVLATTGAVVPVAVGASGSSPATTRTVRIAVAVVAIALVGAAAASAISWATFVILLVPFVVLPEAILYGLRPHGRATLPLGSALRVFGLVAAALFIGLLTLAPTVWLPLREVTFTGTPPTLKNGRLPRKVAAYLLSTSDTRSSLLLDNPRAVIVGRAARDQAGHALLCAAGVQAARLDDPGIAGSRHRHRSARALRNVPADRATSARRRMTNRCAAPATGAIVRREVIP
jgi:hypothetical protein